MAQAQYPDLIELTDYPFPVYVSSGAEQRAHRLAARCAQGHHFLGTTLAFEAEICLLVLAPEHWQLYTGSPMFGIPQTIDASTVVVAGQNSELWDMVIPPLERLPVSTIQTMRGVYGQADGSLDIAAYMDLLPVHEVGHLFVDQAAGQFDFHRPRRWVVELFCNLCLHAYVALHEKDYLPALEVFPHSIVAIGGGHYQHQSLGAFETLYASMEPPNFVWYLSRLHTAAKAIYDSAGIDALQRLYQLIVQAPEQLSDEQLAVSLGVEVHPAVADVLASWSTNNMKSTG
jgi:hypothetical protein